MVVNLVNWRFTVFACRVLLYATLRCKQWKNANVVVVVAAVVVVVVVEDLENNFKDSLLHLMPVLVGRGQLVVKEVNGAKLTGKDLAQYFEVLGISGCFPAHTCSNCILTTPIAYSNFTALVTTMQSTVSVMAVMISPSGYCDIKSSDGFTLLSPCHLSLPYFRPMSDKWQVLA